MLNPRVQRVYVSYEFLGNSGADLETPVSLPKPKHYVDKCYFNFKKSEFYFNYGWLSTSVRYLWRLGIKNSLPAARSPVSLGA